MHPLARLERTMRNRPSARDLSIEPLVEAMRRDANRRAGRVGVAAEAWLELAPRDLVDATAVEGFRNGVLAIAVTSAAAKFRLDRVLREGLEARLRELLPALRSVKVRLAAESQ